MHIISRKAIREFIKAYPDAESSLDSWYREAKKAKWQNLAELKEQYSHADLVGRYTVFNIRKNSYRLITRMHYRGQTIFIIKILTHKQYDGGKWKA
jgi:mRNA interferase HigB